MTFALTNIFLGWTVYVHYVKPFLISVQRKSTRLLSNEIEFCKLIYFLKTSFFREYWPTY